MSSWWHDPHVPWRAALAGLLFDGMDPVPNVQSDRLNEVIDEHRLAPWLHARHPAESLMWAAEARRAMALALHQQQTLCDLLDALAARNIVPTLLKGVPLSLLAYEQPWHRPMRDLDLLMASPEEALAAQQYLLELGYRTLDNFAGDPAALLGERHQLPVLLAPDGTTYVELHLRLFHGTSDEQALHAPVERTVLGRPVRFLRPEAQFLHLVGHAARDHRFDNGPQILIDLAMLWQRETIDIVRLKQLAHQIGLERHCSLLTKMTSDAFPSAGLDPSLFADELGAQARCAWQLMTSPIDAVAAARDRLQTRSGGASRSLARLFPSPSRLASTQGKANGPVGLFSQYLAHYRRLATERLPRMVGKSSSDDTLAALIDWLEA